VPLKEDTGIEDTGIKDKKTDFLDEDERLSALAAPAPRKTVGIAGTFDVQNYGDLLFPQIAAAALKRRDRDIGVIPFSVIAKSEPAWPFRVRPVEDIAVSVATLSAMLIGGGQIVRFDRSYPIETPAHAGLPFAYWLTPAVLAALAGKPVIWNAVGASTGWSHSHWHDELLRQVFAASYFIGVRDSVSRDDLAKIAPEAAIQFLPDTAFGLSRLWPLEEESAEFKQWKASHGLAAKYVVIQASTEAGKHGREIQSVLEPMEKTSAVVLPVCWCHGDRAEKFPAMKGAFLEREWPAPRLIAEIIGRSEFVFASSLHACITALSYGVPAARMTGSTGGKYEQLDEFEGIARIDQKDALLRLARRGRYIEPRVTEFADRLDRYWDDVADVVLRPPQAHGHLAQALMMAWMAAVCGDRKHLGAIRRSAEGLRGSLAEYFPQSRRALRSRLAALKRSARAAFRAAQSRRPKHESGNARAQSRP